MTTNQDRAAFKTWFDANYRTKLRDHAIIDKCWLAWQAALQSQKQKDASNDTNHILHNL